MTKKDELEVWVAINEDGAYEVGTSVDEARERYDDNVGGEHIRLVKLNVLAAAPKATEVDVTVPDETEQEVAATVG